MKKCFEAERAEIHPDQLSGREQVAAERRVEQLDADRRDLPRRAQGNGNARLTESGVAGSEQQHFGDAAAASAPAPMSSAL